MITKFLVTLNTDGELDDKELEDIVTNLLDYEFGPKELTVKLQEEED